MNESSISSVERKKVKKTNICLMFLLKFFKKAKIYSIQSQEGSYFFLGNKKGVVGGNGHEGSSEILVMIILNLKGVT